MLEKINNLLKLLTKSYNLRILTISDRLIFLINGVIILPILKIYLFFFLVFFSIFSVLIYEFIILIIWLIRTSFNKFSNVPKDKPVFIEKHFVVEQYLLDSAEKLLRWHIGNKLQVYLFEPFLLPFANSLDNFLLDSFSKKIEKYMIHFNIVQEIIDAIWLFIKNFKPFS